MKEKLYAQFLDTLRELCPINGEIEKVINEYVVVQKSPKGAHLVTIGDVADRFFYIGTGLVRSYYYIDGKEVTSWIAAESDFAVSTQSFLKQEPSLEGIELLEDSQLLYISYPDLQRIYRNYPATNLIGRALSEKYLLVFDERIRSLRMLTAEERYYRFCQQHPGIGERVPLKHIASYLGLSRFTLSRLRGQKIKVNLIQ
ncbi:Crp/Fnr family transcriptional regulator [Larkinella ripae]